MCHAGDCISWSWKASYVTIVYSLRPILRSCSPLNIFANPTRVKLMQPLENVHAHKYYAELIANKQRASITCGYAGEHKGKAIYAINTFAPGDRIWSEVPFVAMQHEENKQHIQCCAHCFIPLIDAPVEWERVRNAAEALIASSDRKLDSLATFSELEKTIEYVKAKKSDENYEQKYFATRGTAASCEQCGEVYCSEDCRISAYRESHALCCSYSLQNDSAMGHFINHSIGFFSLSAFCNNSHRFCSHQ